MGSLLFKDPSGGTGNSSQPEVQPAPEDSLPEWLGVMESKAEVKACTVKEDYEYTGGSIHPPWHMRLLLSVDGFETSRVFTFEQLDPVVILRSDSRMPEWTLRFREQLVYGRGRSPTLMLSRINWIGMDSLDSVEFDQQDNNDAAGTWRIVQALHSAKENALMLEMAQGGADVWMYLLLSGYKPLGRGKGFPLKA